MSERAPKPKPVTAQYLQASAMHYLAGRMASTAMLRSTLERRAMKRLSVRRLEADVVKLIDQTVAKLVDLGLIDDAVFTESRVRNLAGRGLPKRAIAQRLRQKGIDAAAVAPALDGKVDDAAQAIRYAERRRLGPWRRTVQTPVTRKKDLAALARAGFSYAVALAALDSDGGTDTVLE
jgi:regulatory protein